MLSQWTEKRVQIMPDVVDKQTRSRMMSGIRGKNTRPELLLRRALHKRGFRYRLHVKSLPGKPDLVLPKYRAVIFAHGCFWHRHPGCRYTTTPATNTEFWLPKFQRTIDHDEVVMKQLTERGWRVGVVWECALRQLDIDTVIDAIVAWLIGDDLLVDIAWHQVDENLGPGDLRKTERAAHGA